MRCLTLADALRGRGCDIMFMCDQLPDPLRQGLEARGHLVVEARAADRELERTGRRAAWVVVDHYGLDRTWEISMRRHTHRVMVIDDLADRPHDCDLLLDQNFYRDLERRYDRLVPRACRKALGPAYALLRPAFYDARRSLRVRDGSMRHILVTFGGSDATGETGKAIEAVLALDSHLAVDVVVPAFGPHRNRIVETWGMDSRVTLHENVEDMASLMVAADLAIGAGGATTWERCYLGLPTVTLVTAPNQAQATCDLASTGAILNLGWGADVAREDISRTIAGLIADPASLRGMSEKALALMPRLPGREPAAAGWMVENN